MESPFSAVGPFFRLKDRMKVRQTRIVNSWKLASYCTAYSFLSQADSLAPRPSPTLKHLKKWLNVMQVSIYARLQILAKEELLSSRIDKAASLVGVQEQPVYFGCTTRNID